MNSRRSFLRLLAGAPCAGGMMMAGQAGAQQAPQPAQPAPQGRDVFKELGVKTFINASGTLTVLSGTLMLPEVQAAIAVASKRFARLEEVQDAVGKRLAELLHCEAAMVTSGCASAMMLGTAACLTGTDNSKAIRLPDLTGMKTEVIRQAGHSVIYDHAIRNCGIKMVDVTTRQDLEAKINEKTAMMFYFNGGNGRIMHEEWVAVAKKRGIPTLIDAAADVPPKDNLFRFTRIGFDLVCISGGKMIRGPQSAGLLLGKKELIAGARLNWGPNGNHIGRTNKVNKEEIAGMLVAVEKFLSQEDEERNREWQARGDLIVRVVSAGNSDVRGAVTLGARDVNHFHRARITWNPAMHNGLTSDEMSKRLANGNPSIVAGGGGGGTAVSVCVATLDPGEDQIVADRIKAILGGAM